MKKAQETVEKLVVWYIMIYLPIIIFLIVGTLVIPSMMIKTTTTTTSAQLSLIMKRMATAIESPNPADAIKQEFIIPVNEDEKTTGVKAELCCTPKTCETHYLNEQYYTARKGLPREPGKTNYAFKTITTPSKQQDKLCLLKMDGVMRK